MVFLEMCGTVEKLDIRPFGGMSKQSIELAVDTFSMQNIKAFSKKELFVHISEESIERRLDALQAEKHIRGTAILDDMIKFTSDKYNYESLWETAYIASRNLDTVIDKN